MFKRASVVAALMCAFTCTHAQSETATYTSEVRVMVHDYDGLREGYYENDPALKVMKHSVEGIGSAEARAQIGLGINKVFATFSSPNAANPAGTLMADASTRWVDEVTINSPGLEGTVGTFTASLRVEGNALFAMDGVYAQGGMEDLYGFWDAWIGTSTDGGGSYLVGGWFGSWYSDGMGGVWQEGDELNQPLTEVTLEFIYGQPFHLRGNLQVYFDAENPELKPGTIEGVLDFSNSAYWDGISGFFNAEGQPVRSVKMTSKSGTDWTQPVDGTLLPKLSSLEVSPTTIVGGNTATGTIKLDAATPGSGTAVETSDNTTALVTPASVFVPAGSAEASFEINTTYVSSTATRSVSATLQGVTKTVSITIVPPALGSFSITPNTIESGLQAIGEITLTGPAKVGGTAVSVTDNSSAINTPASATVQAGSTAGKFAINTTPLATTATRTVTVSYNGITKTANILLLAAEARVASLRVGTNPLKGGQSTTGTVTLTMPAPAGGAVVSLSDNSSAIATPVSVTVPAGQKTANFLVTTSKVTTAATRQLSASYGGRSVSLSITLNP